MKKFKFKIRGNDYGVEIKKLEDNVAFIEVNGTPYEVEIEREVKPTKTPTIVRKVVNNEVEKIAKREGGASHPLTAPLPGKIIEIKVAPGDIVKSGDVLLIMEAMKMENNVLADKDGVIETLKVRAGDSVLEGDVLLEMI